jgi:amino acid adenylation domain-containing protein
MFTLEDLDRQRVEEGYRYKNQIAKFDMTLAAVETSDYITFSLEYCTRLFKKETIERFINYFRSIISSILKNFYQDILDVEILGEEEKLLLLFEFNDTSIPHPKDKTIHRLFEEQAGRSSDRVALVDDPGIPHLTYRELNERCNRLAWQLRKRGVEYGTIVGIMVEPSLEMVIGIMGTWKAGAAYLPIAPDYPGERIDFLLADSGARILLTNLPVRHRFNCQLSIVNCQLLMSRPGTPLHHSAFSTHHSGNFAYVIYTSGTTGRPKGVVVRHYSIVSRLAWMQKQYCFDAQDVVLQKTVYTFDVSVCEMSRWIPGGGRMCLLKAGDEKDPEMIIRAIEKYRVTIIEFVPSMLSVFLDFIHGAATFPGISCLKRVFVGGEVFGLQLAQRFNEVLHKRYGTQIINAYGPTEAAVDVTHFNCSGWEQQHLETVPIGKPIGNTRLYIVDSHGNLQPVGVTGELCISGAGLAAGYLNRPELTAQKFVISHQSLVNGNSTNDQCPMTNDRSTNDLLYRTGDLARWLPDGNIEFLGRIDYQVKIRGFRIELKEIEHRLTDCEIVKEAAVLVKEDTAGNNILCAYVVFTDEFEDRSPVSTQLRDYLGQSLPGYMIPSHFVRVEKMPLTAGGKLDRRALPEPEIVPGEAYTAPRNEIEEKIADIWAEILGIESDMISIDANFFDLGGHSLKATTVVSRVHKELGFKLQLMEFFRTPTIRGIFSLIEALDWVHRQEPVLDSKVESEEIIL